jgi:hypothetical protein
MDLHFEQEYPDARLVTIAGTRWRVREAERLHPRKVMVLAFERPGLTRIIQDFPANWRDLPDAELFALSHP